MHGVNCLRYSSWSPSSSSSGRGDGTLNSNTILLPSTSKSSSSTSSNNSSSSGDRVQPLAMLSTISSPAPFASRRPSPSQRRPKVGEVIRRINSPRPVPPPQQQQQQQGSGTAATDKRLTLVTLEGDTKKQGGGGSTLQEQKDTATNSRATDDMTRATLKNMPQPPRSPRLATPQRNVVPPGVAVPGEAAQWGPVPWANLKRPRGGTWKFSYPLLASIAPDPEQCPCRMRGSQRQWRSFRPGTGPLDRPRKAVRCSAKLAPLYMSCKSIARLLPGLGIVPWGTTSTTSSQTRRTAPCRMSGTQRLLIAPGSDRWCSLRTLVCCFGIVCRLCRICT